MQSKKLFCILAVFIVISSSCSKSVTPIPEPIPTFKFLVDGRLFQWNGPGDGKSICLLCGPFIRRWDSTYFTLSSSEPLDAFAELSFRFNATALNITTYSDTTVTPVGFSKSAHFISTKLTTAASTEIGDFAIVTFTSIRDGKYYDGTFSARLTLSPFGTAAAKIKIEEGEFHNVKFF